MKYPRLHIPKAEAFDMSINSGGLNHVQQFLQLLWQSSKLLPSSLLRSFLSRPQTATQARSQARTLLLHSRLPLQAHKPEPPKPPVCQRWCFEVICRPCAPLQNGPLAYDGKPELREDAKFDGYDGYDAKDDGAY